MDQSSKSKKVLRKRNLQRRSNLTIDEISQISSSIGDLLLERINITDEDTIHSYLPKRDTKEVDTFIVLEKIQFKFPNVTYCTFLDNKQLNSVSFDLQTNYKEDGLGIPVPQNHKSRINPTVIDLVLVPCLSFDDRGYRVGYGEGLYDKFLSELNPNCLKVGLCYEFGFVKSGIEAEEHDIKLDYIVTEKKIYERN